MPLSVSPAARRRAIFIAFASAALVAIGAYGSVLWSARAGWNAELRPLRAVQVLGSLANVSKNATLEPTLGSVAFTLNATARWRIPNPGPTGSARRSIVIVSGELSFPDQTGNAYVTLDGVPAATLRGVEFGNVNVPPGNARGFRIAIPPESRCGNGACELEVRVRRGYWRIYRVALVDDEPISSVGEFR